MTASWRESIDRLAATTVAAVLALLDRAEAGDVAAQEFVATAAAIVAAANAKATALGDLGVAADVSREIGRAVAPLGVPLDPETGPRLSKAIEGIVLDADLEPLGWGRMTRDEQNEFYGHLRERDRTDEYALRRKVRAERAARREAGLETPEEYARRERERLRKRLSRLADNEPRERAQEARGAAIARSRVVTGWRRKTSGKGCDACTGLAARDVVLSPNTPMWRHTGCSCTQIPTTREVSR